MQILISIIMLCIIIYWLWWYCPTRYDFVLYFHKLRSILCFIESLLDLRAKFYFYFGVVAWSSPVIIFLCGTRVQHILGENKSLGLHQSIEIIQLTFGCSISLFHDRKSEMTLIYIKKNAEMTQLFYNKHPFVRLLENIICMRGTMKGILI